MMQKTTEQGSVVLAKRFKESSCNNEVLNSQNKEEPILSGLRVSENAPKLYLLLALTFAGMLSLSWKKWPDPLVDFGRELYLPWRILEGEVLYVELSHLFGPLSPYLNAVWMWILGANADSIFLGNIVLTAFVTVLLLLSIRHCSNQLTSIVGAFVFISIFAFGQYTEIGNYNFIAPYSHQLTHGIVFALITLLLLNKGLKLHSLKIVSLAGLSMGLTLLTKAEPSLALLVASGSLLLLYGLTPGKKLALAPTCIVFTTAAIAVVILTACLFAASMPFTAALGKIFASYPGQVSPEVMKLKFYKTVTGTDQAFENLQQMFVWLGIYAAYFAPLFLLSFRPQRLARLDGVIAVSYLISTCYLVQSYWVELARAFPLLVSIAFILLSIRWLKQRKDMKHQVQIRFSISFCAFALVLMLKIFLHVRLVHYGFALALPATMVVIIGLLYWLPSLIEKLGGNKHCFQLGAALIIFAVVAQYVQAELAYFSRKTSIVASLNESFYADNSAKLVNAALEQIDSTLSTTDTLAVLPEGISINFLSRRRNATSFFTLMPPEMIIHGERKIVDSFRSDAPDYILLMNKDTSEYGFKFFGRDYGQNFGKWIHLNYEAVTQIGQRPFVNTEAGAMLLKRRRSPMLSIDRNAEQSKIRLISINY